MNGKQLLNYLRELQGARLDLEKLRVGIIADSEGDDMIFMGVKRIFTNGKDTLAIDIGLQDGKEAIAEMPAPVVSAETQRQANPQCFTDIQKALYPDAVGS